MVDAKETLKTLRILEAELLLRSRTATSAEERYAVTLAWKAVHEEIEEFEEHQMKEGEK